MLLRIDSSDVGSLCGPQTIVAGRGRRAYLGQIQGALAFCIAAVDVSTNVHEGVDDVSCGGGLWG